MKDDALSNFLEDQELVNKGASSAEKFHQAEIRRIQKQNYEKKQELRAEIFRLRKQVAQANNNQLALAYEKLKAKFKRTVKARQEVEATVSKIRSNSYRLTLERDFYKDRIVQLHKYSGLKDILNHVDCPDGLLQYRERLE